jgi:DNA-binding transcriptional MocR family regulator
LATPGSPVLVESPTYPGILAVTRAAGLWPVPVPVDADGVRTDLLAEAFAVIRARLFVCQPLFHNPTGTILSPQRRTAVLGIAPGSERLRRRGRLRPPPGARRPPAPAAPAGRR